MTNEKNTRKAAVAGQFYPAGHEAATRELERYFSPFEDCEQRDDIRAVIVPHAGWVFSGEVAASAFSRINPSKVYDRVFLIGPSHRVYLDAVSIDSESTHYATPLGEVEVDCETCRKLAEDTKLFKYDKRAHLREHCLEVELPFLQYHLKTMPPIVPVVIATDDNHSPGDMCGGYVMIKAPELTYDAIFDALKNGAYYDVDQGVEPDFIIMSYENFYDREALADYIDRLF